MEWRDEGLILGVKAHGETSAILEVMTPVRGRHLGLVKGGRSRRLRPVLQPGNLIEVTWRARLEEHLGQFQVEPLKLRAAAILENRAALSAVNALCAHLRLLAERDPHANLYDAANIILENLEDIEAIANLLARFELALLDELGFGLDLSQCVASGSTQELVWVSPKSGGAVSKSAGAPYESQLLVLPAFLRSGNRSTQIANIVELQQAFALTGYFLNKNIYSVRDITPCENRTRLINLLEKP